MEPSPSPRRPFTASMFLLGATTALTAVMIETANAQTSVSTSSSSATVSAQAVNFDIPAGKLSSALVAFSTQAHVPLSSQTPTLAGKMFSGLRGQFTPSAALSHILSGSGLSYRVVEGHGFQIVPSPGAANITLGPVRVGGTVVHENPTGPGVGYVATTTMAGTKTDTPIIEIPNSVYVITKKQMEDQQPQNIREALRYTPGIYSEPTGTAGNGYPGSTGNSSSGILQRGFSTLQFIDGLQTNSLSAGETAFLERVETVNGPASVMYGQTSPGGMIGMSLKKPTDKPLHEVSVGFGNWGRYETTVDLSDKITKSGNLKYRIAAIGDTQGTQTDYVNYHRVGVLPSITWDIDKKTSLTFLGSYIYTPGNGTYSSGYPLYGTLINNGRSRLARSTFLGEPNWNIQSDKSAMFEYLFSHTFNKYIKFEQTFRWEKSSLDNKTLSLSGSDDEETVERTPLVQNYQSDTIGMDARFSGKLNTGPISHTWVVGSDFRKYDIQLAYQYDYTQGDNIINTYNPVYGSYTRCFGFTAACKDFGGISSFDRFQEGVYFQDQIKWKGLSILIGGRNDWVNTDNNIHTENNLATNPARITGSEHRYGPQSAFTWRAGIVYHFNFGLAPYFSYSTSFLPQNGFSATGNIFSPLTGKQLEAGIKYEVPHTDVLLTAAAYHIDEDHYLITDPNNTNSSADAGRVTSKGFELSAHANITKNLRFLASYTYTDARYSSTNLTSSLISVSGGVISRGSTVSQKGKYLQTVPRNMASAFLDYTFTLPSLEGFGVNGGVRYIGFTYSDAVNSLKIPDYVLFDIGAHYDFGRRFPILKGLHAQLSISNLTNKYYITSCATSACYIGQGRRVYGNLTYNW